MTVCWSLRIKHELEQILDCITNPPTLFPFSLIKIPDFVHVNPPMWSRKMVRGQAQGMNIDQSKPTEAILFLLTGLRLGMAM